MITPWPTLEKIRATFFDKNLGNLREEVPTSTDLVVLKQTHSADIIAITNDNKKLEHEGDGLVTNLSQVALTIHTADCLPLLAYDDEVIGACHGGWRGLTKGILENWIAKMRILGARPETLHVAIGPAIGPCHFEVGKDVSTQLLAGVPTPFHNVIRRPHTDVTKDYIDLKELARFKLLKLGLDHSKILITPECTYCDPAHFHSYRREKGAKKGLRLEALIVKPRR